MSNKKVPVDGALVNPSLSGKRKGTFGPQPGKAKRGRPRKQSDDGPSLPKQWADLMLVETNRPWYSEANHTNGGAAVYQWNGNYLQLVGAEEGAALVARWMDNACPDKASDRGAVSAWSFGSRRLRLERPMPVQNRDRNIIPCADVYLEMAKNGTLTALAPDPSYGMTYALNVAAGTAVGKKHKLKRLPAKSKFRQFIERALPDPAVRALVQEQCGMTLLPGNYQMAIWWSGQAGSGKSTLAELCKAMQRHVATATLSELGDTFGLEPLVGASLVVVDEVEAEKWAEGKWKSLVGWNGVTINRKNEKALLNYSLRAKWIITGNDKPFVRDKSDGVWRRICLVCFEVVIPEDERVGDFHNVLLAEEGGLILDWMLEGAARLVRRGHFMPEHERPASVREAKEEARNDCDSVRAWVKEFGVGVGEETKSKDQVYTQYEKWCVAAHQTPLERRVFWKGLRQQVRGIVNINRRVNGEQVYFCNLSWKLPEPRLVVNNSAAALSAKAAENEAERARQRERARLVGEVTRARLAMAKEQVDHQKVPDDEATKEAAKTALLKQLFDEEGSPFPAQEPEKKSVGNAASGG